MTTLSKGHRLGPYEIVSALGSGGMGEVYCARDSTLGRHVAIKVLPERFALDADRLARFKREAHILASLNHTNIAGIYGLEESSAMRALVLEFVDGPTLADRIAHGPLAIDEALAVARQIADALEAAHDQGIVHRDLKPSNIKLRPDGIVKVLDFGLAKALDHPSAAAVDATVSPTITSPALTHAGIILGTAAYMSPEQARGRAADRRSDLWAFGCVLYEILTGVRAFGGSDVSDSLAAVIRDEPDWKALPQRTPVAIRRLLRRCLAKDRKERIADASTARLEIDAARARDASEDVDRSESRPPLWRRPSTAWAVAIAAIAVAAAISRIALTQASDDDTRVVQAIVPPAENTVVGAPSFLVATQALSIALAPDGRSLAYVASGPSGPWRIWLRPLGEGVAHPLAGTEGGTRPFWSPDSRSIAFFADNKLKRVDIGGGPVLTICDNPGTAGGGTWNTAGVIVFGIGLVAGSSGPLYRVEASGGTPVQITAFEATVPDTKDVTPSFLPDGRHFLYTRLSSTTMPSTYIGALDESGSTRLMDGATNVQYAAGRILFLRGTTLVAQPFDAQRLVLSGEVAPVLEGVMVDPFSRTGVFSVSSSGILAYRSSLQPAPSQLTWFDRSGRVSGVLGEPGDYNTVNLSPDGTRAAVTLRDADGNLDVWLVDIARGVRTRFTFDAADETQALWSPDGTRIVFDSLRSGRVHPYQKSATGSGNEDQVDASSVPKYPTSWSPDGAFLVSNSPAGSARTGNDLWIVPLAGDRKPFVYLQTPFQETRAQFSPDGKWIAYGSTESGRFEVYVAPFPGPGRAWRVSAAGGNSPRWRRDGRELFFVSADSMLMSVDVDGRSASFVVGQVQPLFSIRMRDQTLGIPYSVTADGQRFLVNTPVDRNAATPISLVINWPGLLRH